MIRPIAVLAVLSSISGCYATIKPSHCVGDVTEFPNCDKANSIALKCSNLSKQETIDCFCTQELLDAYVACKGEFRRCTLGNSYDSSVDDEIANWQDACGPYLSDDITTPSAPDPTRTIDRDACEGIAESCAHSSQSVTSCSSAYTKPADITSCRCQESIVSLASVCNIDGANSCVGKAVITSNIWEFRNCEAATDVFQTTDVSQTTEESELITKKPDDSTAQDETATLVFGPTSTVVSTTSSGRMFLQRS
ncbi:hypothetical protein FALBO_15088 [Fusarium albosuccineum]|uniref:Extracellular membrane protein CFEM domain-containing protein n=1 Tax=Fusarium albosuccineum TaxID=1237068 RepID=A0A8H4KVI5_9HYPO|nr:hypothetical protein FALBO_15088 [Fusarium albosuccineum]